MEHVSSTAKEVVTFSKVLYLINSAVNLYDFVILLNIKVVMYGSGLNVLV